jgi:hypothetical protein
VREPIHAQMIDGLLDVDTQLRVRAWCDPSRAGAHRHADRDRRVGTRRLVRTLPRPMEKHLRLNHQDRHARALRVVPSIDDYLIIRSYLGGMEYRTDLIEFAGNLLERIKWFLWPALSPCPAALEFYRPNWVNSE